MSTGSQQDACKFLLSTSCRL